MFDRCTVAVESIFVLWREGERVKIIIVLQQLKSVISSTASRHIIF